jgi:8-oxo-dGTP pyrophosphatase MutT (NUDIX family)
MQLIFSDQSLPTQQTKSLFLAGPSPRTLEVEDWRPAALKELERLGFDGTVFIPIPKDKFAGTAEPKFGDGWSYDDQVNWECAARAMSDVIVFWVPRSLDYSRKDLGMPAFTTNFELGEDLASGKVVYGRPPHAAKVGYLDHRAKDAGLHVHESLVSLLDEAATQLGEGAFRIGGEAQVPLLVWRTPAFQGWYRSLRAAGNRLDGARVLNQVTVGSKGRGFLFCFALKVNIWVEKEQRHKSNEFIVARPGTSAVVAVYREPKGATDKLHVVLVREFRSPVNNEQGFVFELPAGSSSKPGTPPDVNAQQELVEETGLLVQDLSRFKRVGKRQLAASFSVHQAEVYAIELTKEEFEQLRARSDSGIACGDPAHLQDPSSERTYVELTTMDEVFDLPVDYATLGMLVEGLRVLQPKARTTQEDLTRSSTA